MNILVTGANGQLGQALRDASVGSANKFVFSDVMIAEGMSTSILDITNISEVRKLTKEERIDVIINCAAYTNVEKAEDDEERARILNCDAVRNLAVVSKEQDMTLIHMSTDFVYNGSKASPYVETDTKNPVNAYARTKYAGEQAIIETGCRYILFRTAWLFSQYGSNFMKTMIRLTGERESLNVVYDQVGTPTYAPELAKLILKVIDNNMLDRTGEYNFTCEGSVSWYDFAVMINYLSGHHCRIHPCSSAEYGSKVTRPSFSVLDKHKVRDTFGITIPHWFESLEFCIKNLSN